MKVKELKKIIDQFLSDPNNMKWDCMDWRDELSRDEAFDYLYRISYDYFEYKIMEDPEAEYNEEEIQEIIFRDFSPDDYFKDLMNWLNNNRKAVEWMEQAIIDDQLTRGKEEYLFEDHMRTSQKMQIDQVLPAMIHEFAKMKEEEEEEKRKISSGEMIKIDMNRIRERVKQRREELKKQEVENEEKK